MKIVNANLRSKAELVRQLVQGEVFYYQGEKVLFNETCDNPFRLGFTSLAGHWDKYKHFNVEACWYENIDKPIACFIGDVQEHVDRKLFIRMITEYRPDNGYHFKDASDTGYRFATPLTADDIIG